MLNPIKNPFVTITLTDELRDTFIEAFNNETKANIPDRIKLLAENKFEGEIQLEDIVWVKKRLPNGTHIYKLLENCAVTLPQPELEPRNPELEARIQRLKAMEEERKYQEMTRNVDTSRVRHAEDSIAYQGSCIFTCLPFLSKNYITSWFQRLYYFFRLTNLILNVISGSKFHFLINRMRYNLKEMNRQLIGVLQVVLSISTGFAFGFIGLNWMAGPLDAGVRLLLGLIVAFVIGTAELYFFVKKIAEPIDPHSSTDKKKN